jgi:p-aminobenzoyl-glutamate transporter AbgT
MIGRLLMILTGFVLAMLGVITFIHSGEHQMLGILISFAGVASMFGGLPNHE